MVSYPSPETITQTLTFSKAELAYVLAVLTSSVSVLDDFTKFDLIEVRHYINLIKDRVAMSISDGTLKNAIMNLISGNGEKKETGLNNPTKKKESFPSIEELKKKFPSLSESEIQEIIYKVRAEKERKELTKLLETSSNETPPPPSFIAQPRIDSFNFNLGNNSSESKEHDRTNSMKFASLLGGN